MQCKLVFWASKDLMYHVQQEMYEEVDGMLYELDHEYNSLNHVFNVKVVNGSLHYKSNFIHDLWWTPKKNVSSQLMIAFEEMESK